MSWQSHVEKLLYEGEQVLAEAQGHKAGIVLTSHRLLVFTPQLDGANVRTVERPNVNGVSKDASGDSRWLTAGMKWLVTGIALAIVGLLLDLEGVMGEVSTGETASEMGVGWVSDLFGLFNTVFALLDDVLLFVGLLSLFGGIGLLGWYWQTRSDVLEIAVAGSSNIEVPGIGFRAAGIGDLQEAIEPEIVDGGSEKDTIDADAIDFPSDDAADEGLPADETEDGTFPTDGDPFEPAVADDSNRSNR